VTVPSSLSVPASDRPSVPDFPALPPDIAVRPATRDDLELAASIGGVPPNLPVTWTEGVRRPEWTYLALRDGALLGRAVWWGWASSELPILTDTLDLADSLTGGLERLAVGTALAAAGFAALVPPGQDRQVICWVPAGWRSGPEAPAVLEKLAMWTGAGASLLVERLDLLWERGNPVPSPSDRLRFGSVDDDTLVDLVARCGDGSLDAHTAQRRARLGRDGTARFEVEQMRDFPGPRDWWRAAYTPDGEPVGFVLPTADGVYHAVGYLGVVPEHRGRGYVNDLLGEGTRFLAVEQDAERIVANTDVGNVPMAAAFARAGYADTGRHRLDLV
jgi:ribosomal protein S18 acetylase RimI-like enzyme